MSDAAERDACGRTPEHRPHYWYDIKEQGHLYRGSEGRCPCHDAYYCTAHAERVTPPGSDGAR